MISAPYQWQVALALLDPVRGSEQAGTRPVLIISRESVNGVLSIVTVLPMTSKKLNRRVYETEVLLSARTANLPSESIVMAQQIRSVAKERLISSYGVIEEEDLRDKIRYALSIHLDLKLA